MIWPVEIVCAGEATRPAHVSAEMRTRRSVGLSLLVIVLAAAGCSSIGPSTVPRDRLDYISAVGESWKEQTLLNIVRLRYGDAPSFVDVSSVISAYTFQGQVSAGGQFSSNLTSTVPSNLATVGGSALYLDRPTITYTLCRGTSSPEAFWGLCRPAKSSNWSRPAMPRTVCC